MCLLSAWLLLAVLHLKHLVTSVLFVGVAYPAGGDGLPLFIFQVLLNVDKRVEEDGSHLGGFEVREKYLICERDGRHSTQTKATVSDFSTPFFKCLHPSDIYTAIAIYYYALGTIERMYWQ